MGASSSLEQNKRYDITTDEEWYNFDDHDFVDAHSGWVLVGACTLNAYAYVCTCV